MINLCKAEDPNNAWQLLTYLLRCVGGPSRVKVMIHSVQADPHIYGFLPSHPLEKANVDGVVDLEEF